MLYQSWSRIACQQPHAVALYDLADHREWTFGQLLQDAETRSAPGQGLVYPRGRGAAFVLEVLRGWRWNAVVVPLEEGQSPPPALDSEAALTALRSRLPDCVHLKSTSATTGEPRLVAFTGAQLAADAEQIVATMGLRADWPNLGVISMAHSYGYSNLVLPLLLHGIPLLLGHSPLPEAVMQAAARVRSLTLPAVPALWRAWHDARAIPSGVRLAISAGAPLPVPLEQDVFAATGLKLHNFYGSSECGGIAYDATESPRSADAACAGAPMEGVALRCDAGGRLEVRSRAVALGYWPVADPALGEGRFSTSDLAELKDGRVYLRGRSSDLINVAGRKVAPEIIERALLAHSAVRDCIALGLPDVDGPRTEQVAACVVLRGEAGAEELRDFLLGCLPAWQVPRHWRFLESLPVSERGKLSRAQLRGLFH
jgi:long-chain acyl-CoA synthetase